MQIDIKIDEFCSELRIIIVTNQITDEIQEIINKLSNPSARMLTGFRGNTLKILNQQEIIRIYTQSGKVLAATVSGEYTLRFRLYELEARLDPKNFVRISNSEIINLKKVKGFDLSLAGNIRVTLTDGAVTYVSRRYISKIKKLLEYEVNFYEKKGFTICTYWCPCRRNNWDSNYYFDFFNGRRWKFLPSCSHPV